MGPDVQYIRVRKPFRICRGVDMSAYRIFSDFLERTQDCLPRGH